ncbi:MAG: DUF362 domain-containing protein [Planctomycetota bacterium]|jgi:uncharacterized protein (DUF362 family)
MPNPVVTLTKCTDYSPAEIAKAIQSHFELNGGLDKFVKPGDSVLIKPNLIAPRSPRHATQTHPVVILETAKLLKDFGAKPFIADSPAWSSAYNCIRALKLDGPLKKLAVPVKQLNKPSKCQIGDTTVGISSIALEADAIINLPKFKSHQQLVTTFAVKNMFGCVAGKKKAWWHFVKGSETDQFCTFLIDIYRFLNPVLTIIDGVIAMDGPGPIRGRSRPLGWLIGGTDPIACEIVCSRLINMDPDDVPVIKTAKKLNFGCSDFEKIEFPYEPFPEIVCTDFEPAELIPIRFSFPHVCKSVCKQLILLLKSGRQNKAD